MPMEKRDDFGTESDGRRSTEYCRFCYQKGTFTDEGITMEQKIMKNIEIAKQMGMPEDKANEMARKTLPKLKRWLQK